MKWKLVLAGDVSAGKSTMCKALLGLEREIHKTQSPAYHANSIIDVPGEYVMHPHLRRNFLAIAQDAETILYVQSAVGEHLGIPPGFLQVRPEQRVLGVINKIDLPEADLAKSEKILERYGILPPYIKLSALDAQQMADFRYWLIEHNYL